jgi:hypothetical protein
VRSGSLLKASLPRSIESGRVADGRVAARCRTSGVRGRRRWRRAQQSIGLALEPSSLGSTRSEVVDDENGVFRDD